MNSPHARFRLLPTVLLVSSLCAAPLFAQDAPPPPQGGGMGAGAGMRGGRQGQAFDPTVLEGPMLPEEFAAQANLDDKQESRYATLYQNLMSSTKVDRAAVREARAKMQAARQNGGGMDRERMQADREKLRPAMENLRRSQEGFDAALKDFLKPEQLKTYEEWKESKREEMRQQFGGQRAPRP